MAKRMSNAQAKRMLRSVLSKTQKLWNWGFSHVGSGPGSQVMTTKDMMAIEAIITKNLKKIR